MARLTLFISKLEGNKLLGAGDAAAAIERYTAAIALHPTAVHHSNRAAAHQMLSQHEQALGDARTAILLDPTFARAYMRLGTSLEATGNAKANGGDDTVLCHHANVLYSHAS